MDTIEIAKAVGALLGGGAGLAALVKLRSEARAATRKADAIKERERKDLIEIAQKAAGDMIERHVAEIGRLSNEVDELYAQNRACQAENSRLNARVEAVEGDNRQLRQENLSLRDELRGLGIDVTAREAAGSFTVIERDRVTVLKPQPKKPKE